MKEQKEVKNISGFQTFDNTPFFSNGQTVTHTPEKFQIDFLSVYPQFTPDGQPTFVINQKNILLDPHVMVVLHRIIGENIKNYEEKFGVIKEPEAIKIAKDQENLKRA